MGTFGDIFLATRLGFATNAISKGAQNPQQGSMLGQRFSVLPPLLLLPCKFWPISPLNDEIWPKQINFAKFCYWPKWKKSFSVKHHSMFDLSKSLNDHSCITKNVQWRTPTLPWRRARCRCCGRRPRPAAAASPSKPPSQNHRQYLQNKSRTVCSSSTHYTVCSLVLIKQSVPLWFGSRLCWLWFGLVCFYRGPKYGRN